MPDYLQIATIVRNEGRNLAEWIAFHEGVGVQGFLIYDNGSTDHTSRLLADVPSATVLDLPGERRQFDAYADAVARADTRWLAFIDPDEYLFSPRHLPLPTVLGAYEQHDAVAVCQLVFGTSGVARPQPSTIRAYTRRAVPGDPHVKSIVQLARVRPGAVSPHHFDCATVDEHHRPLDGPLAAVPTFEHLRINHYYTRSVEEAQAKMRRPAFAVPVGGIPQHDVHRTGLLRAELNQERDEVILPYADLVDATLEAMAIVGQPRLDAGEAALLERCAHVALAQSDASVVEIGASAGDSTRVLAMAAATRGPHIRVYSIDAQKLWPFPGPVTEISAQAHEVSWRGPIGLLVIGPGREQESCRRDFEHLEQSIVSQGIVVFLNGATGLSGFVQELRERGWPLMERCRDVVALRKPA